MVGLSYSRWFLSRVSKQWLLWVKSSSSAVSVCTKIQPVIMYVYECFHATVAELHMAYRTIILPSHPLQKKFAECLSDPISNTFPCLSCLACHAQGLIRERINDLRKKSARATGEKRVLFSSTCDLWMMVHLSIYDGGQPKNRWLLRDSRAKTQK